MIILITASSSSKIYNKASLREECTFDEIKTTLSRSPIIPWNFFRVGSLCGLTRTKFVYGSRRTWVLWYVLPWRIATIRSHNLWEARSRPRCQGPQRSRTGVFFHHILEDEVVGQKEEQGDQRDVEEGDEVNGEFESIRETQNEMTHGTCAWKWDECGPWANAVWCHLNKEKQSRDADNRREHTNDKGATLRDAFMMIGIRTTLTDSHVFQVTSHIVGLVVLCAEIQIHLLSMHQTYSLLTCTRIPCRGSHCKNGRVRCCIYINQVHVHHPFLLLHPRKWFLILLNCAKLLFGTDVWLPKMHNVPPDVDFESSRSPAKSESWKSPYLHCFDVFPTWQYCLCSHVWWM